MKTFSCFVGCLLACGGFSASAQSNCTGSHDSNGDGAVTIADMLDLLSVYGDTDSDSDGVWNSQDLCNDLGACNYDANPTEPCSYLDAVGDCGGYCEEDADGDGMCDWTCGLDSVEFQGHTYPTTQIGDQCWLAQSIRYLPEVTPSNAPGNNFLPMARVWGYQGSDVSEAMTTPNYLQFGCVYNFTALEEWDLCPQGWRNTNPNDWNELIEFAGGPAIAGYMLKDSINWNGIDAFGFNYTAIPGATARSHAWHDSVGTVRFNDGDDVPTGGRYRNEFYQVRCIKD